MGPTLLEMLDQTGAERDELARTHAHTLAVYISRDRKLRPLSTDTFPKKVVPGAMSRWRSDQSKNPWLHLVADSKSYKSTLGRLGSVQCVSHTVAREQGRSTEHWGYSRVPLNRTLECQSGNGDFSFSELVTKIES